MSDSVTNSSPNSDFQTHTMWQKFKRILKHRWLDESDSKRAVPPDMAERLMRRVAASEMRHSGEVRICVEAGLPISYLWRNANARERAVMMFGKLRVWDTEQNNGVLIYLLLAGLYCTNRLFLTGSVKMC